MKNSGPPVVPVYGGPVAERREYLLAELGFTHAAWKEATDSVSDLDLHDSRSDRVDDAYELERKGGRGGTVSISDRLAQGGLSLQVALQYRKGVNFEIGRNQRRRGRGGGGREREKERRELRTVPCPSAVLLTPPRGATQKKLSILDEVRSDA